MMGVESITSISEDLRDAGAERVVKAETDHHLHGYWADYVSVFKIPLCY